MRQQLVDGTVLTTVEQRGVIEGEDGGRIWRIRNNGFDWIGGFATDAERDTEFRRLAVAPISEVDDRFGEA